MSELKKSTPCTYILLAAGFSKRFGIRDKRTVTIGQQSMLELVISHIPCGPTDELIVVLRNKDEWLHLKEIKNLLVVENHHAEHGLRSSLRLGLNAMSVNSDLFMVCLADMPLLKESHYKTLLSHYDHLKIDTKPLIILPKYDGKQIGHPRLFSKEYKEAFLNNTENKSNKEILAKFNAQVYHFQTKDRAYILDIDRPSDLAELL